MQSRVTVVTSGQEDVECSMMNALAEILGRQRHYDRALSMYEECLAKIKRVLGEDHPDTKKH